MRILFLALDVDLSGTTGDSTHVRELAASLSKIGNPITLVGHVPEGQRERVKEVLGRHGIAVEVLDSTRNLSTLRFCAQVAKKFKPDVIYERRFSPKIGVTVGKMTRVPAVVEVNAMIEEEQKILDRESKEALGVGRIKKRIRKYFLRSAKRIVVVSSGIGKGLVSEYGVDSSRIHVVQNGANTDLFRPMESKECMDRLGLNDELRYLCYSGNLAPWQGVEHLLAAFQKVSIDFQNARLLIVGDGILRERLEEISREKELQEVADFHGTVPYEDVPLYVNSAEICVAPFSGILRNVKYGFSGIKLFEYMACGRPFVTTTVCGIEDEIDENNIGLLVPPDSPEDLAEAMGELLSDRQTAMEMGKRGRVLAEKEHSWVSVARRISNILEEVAS